MFDAARPPGRRLQRLRAPITIGENCWLGASVMVCPGVTIGEGTTIGAGSIVTADIPAHVFAAGNACHVIKEIEPESPVPRPATA